MRVPGPLTGWVAGVCCSSHPGASASAPVAGRVLAYDQFSSAPTISPEHTVATYTANDWTAAEAGIG